MTRFQAAFRLVLCSLCRPVRAASLRRVGRHLAAGTFRIQALSPRTGGRQPLRGRAVRRFTCSCAQPRKPP